ncbi:MAG: hypothetical protein H6969_11960 [Gammaproteobacteria bacterium]|nr:hypothetical protein [Gammaproteobacteria bacterium]
MSSGIQYRSVLQWIFGFGASVFLVVASQACRSAVPLTLPAPPTQSPVGELGVAQLVPLESSSDELFAFAQEHASSKGYRFGSGADVMLRNKIMLATQNMMSLPASQRKATTAEAKKNIARFIDEMIAASKEIPGYSTRNPGVIGEETFTKAASQLCPLWPICR